MFELRYVTPLNYGEQWQGILMGNVESLTSHGETCPRDLSLCSSNFLCLFLSQEYATVGKKMKEKKKNRKG